MTPPGRSGPEEKARRKIDAALEASGWIVQDREDMNLVAGRGVAVREFKLSTGHGYADYLLFLDCKAVGVLEAKPEGFTLSGVEVQGKKYSDGLPAKLPAALRPLLDLLKNESLWPYKRWAVKALASQGRKAEAIRLAEDSRSPWASDLDIDRLCEEMLLSTGLVDEAYQRYGLRANRAGTYAAWFRAVAKKYPHKAPGEILDDLVGETPGDEGKWFAAAKDAKLFDEAIALANRTPCSPQTLTRAARDFETKSPPFAIEAGMAALRWLTEGYGYDITSVDVLNAYAHTMKAAENADRVEERAAASTRW